MNCIEKFFVYCSNFPTISEEQANLELQNILCASGAETRFSVTAESNGIHNIPLLSAVTDFEEYNIKIELRMRI